MTRNLLFVLTLALTFAALGLAAFFLLDFIVNGAQENALIPVGASLLLALMASICYREYKRPPIS